MSEEKETEQLLPGISKELLDKITEVLKDYPLKDIVYTLWYVLMTINVSIVQNLDSNSK